MLEPGLDKHKWESQWRQFEECYRSLYESLIVDRAPP
jgi:hypothetical protein